MDTNMINGIVKNKLKDQDKNHYSIFTLPHYNHMLAL